MLKFFFKKELQVESLIYSYLDKLRMTQRNFSRAVNTCIDIKKICEFDFLTEQTHKFESEADDIREEIKSLMYGKALIPESRGDIMNLLDSIDEVPRLFELILHMIQSQKLVIPDFIVPDVKDLIRVSLDGFYLMLRQVKALLSKSDEIRDLVVIIDKCESHCDHIERRIITNLFDSDVDPFLKLQLKELVINLGHISDQVDRVSKKINIISMKRRV
ncbi:MAG: DUF47 family protein [Desulfobacterales bacterium]|nr:DUF47 family protein [Desulfobacterales bacterium]MDD4072229.1 DUF47 family protein [Desulfobacterales bacterium]MDD4393688.1 DUF47 family protein [Desulfobacterales bacterium]